MHSCQPCKDDFHPGPMERNIDRQGPFLADSRSFLCSSLFSTLPLPIDDRREEHPRTIQRSDKVLTATRCASRGFAVRTRLLCASAGTCAPFTYCRARRGSVMEWRGILGGRGRRGRKWSLDLEFSFGTGTT